MVRYDEGTWYGCRVCGKEIFLKKGTPTNEAICAACEKIEALQDRIKELEKFVQHSDICNAKRFCNTDNYGSFTKGCTCGLAALFPDRP